MCFILYVYQIMLKRKKIKIKREDTFFVQFYLGKVISNGSKNKMDKYRMFDI